MRPQDPGIATSLRRSRIRLVAACAVIALASCGHGLEPVDPSASSMTGFGGTITVTSTWPPADSLMDLRVVAFRHYPPTGILEDFLAGRVEFSDALQMNVRAQDYAIRKDTLRGTFAYVVVAQQYGPNPFEHWRVVGVHTVPGTAWTPAPVLLEAGTVRQGVNVTVNFYHLPPQPF